MSFALPAELRDYVDARVGSGEYGNTSEYLRELIRRDQRSQAALRLRDLIADGVESGDGWRLTDDLVDDLRQRAFDSGG